MKKLIYLLLIIPAISHAQIINTKIYDENGNYIGNEEYDPSSGLVTRKDKGGITISTAIRQRSPGSIITYEDDGSIFAEYGSGKKNSMSINSDGSFTTYDDLGVAKTYSNGGLISETKPESNFNSTYSSGTESNFNSTYSSGLNTTIPSSNIGISYQQDEERKKLNEQIGRAQGDSDNYVLFSKLLDENLKNVEKETQQLMTAIQMGMANAYYGSERRRIPSVKVTKKLTDDLGKYDFIALNYIKGRGINKGDLKDILEEHFVVLKKWKKKYRDYPKMLAINISETNKNSVYPNYGFGNKETLVTIYGYTNKREVIYEAVHTNNHPFDLITSLLPKNKYRITPYKTKLKGGNTNIFPFPESVEVMYNSKSFASVPSDHEVTVLLRSNLRTGPNYDGYWYLIYDEKYDISGWIWSGKLEKD